MTAAGFKLRKIRTVQTLGEKLRRARKRKGVDLIEAELSTKVRAKYLEALENEDFAELPSDIYTKGFLLTYANYLGLPAEKMLTLYRHERLVRKNSNVDEFAVGKMGKKKVYTLTPKLVAIVTGSIFCLAAIIYVIFQVLNFVSAPKLAVSSPSKDMVVSVSSVLVAGQTDPGVTVTVNNEKITVDSNGSFSQNFSLEDGLNTVVIDAKNKANKESSKVFVVERKISTAEK